MQLDAFVHSSNGNSIIKFMNIMGIFDAFLTEMMKSNKVWPLIFWCTLDVVIFSIIIRHSIKYGLESWIGVLEWSIGDLEWSIGVVDWSLGLETWIGVLEWNLKTKFTLELYCVYIFTLRCNNEGFIISRL